MLLARLIRSSTFKAMFGGSLIVCLALVTAAAPPAPGPATVLVATAEPPLDAKLLDDALRTYLGPSRIEVRTTSAASEDLRSGLAASQRTNAVLRVSLLASGSVEILLMVLAPRRTILTTMPRTTRDADLYRTLALKVQELLRTTLDQPESETDRISSRPGKERLPSAVDGQLGYTAVVFPAGDLIQQGVLLRGLGLIGSHVRLGLGLRVLAPSNRQSGDTAFHLQTLPLVISAEYLWRAWPFEISPGLLLQGELWRAHTTAAAGSNTDWSTVAGAGASVAVRFYLTAAIRLSLQAGVVGLLLSNRYQIDGTTALDAARLEVPIDLALELGLW